MQNFDFYKTNCIFAGLFQGTKNKQVKMVQKKHYQSPVVQQEFSVRLEAGFLGASIVDQMTVVSEGQGVTVYQFSEPEFNHQWEEVTP